MAPDTVAPIAPLLTAALCKFVVVEMIKRVNGWKGKDQYRPQILATASIFSAISGVLVAVADGKVDIASLAGALTVLVDGATVFGLGQVIHRVRSWFVWKK